MRREESSGPVASCRHRLTERDFGGLNSPDDPAYQSLWTAVKSLAEQPEMGRPGRVHGTRELVVSDTPFVVPYRVVGSEIEILRVLPGARDWPKSF